MELEIIAKKNIDIETIRVANLDASYFRLVVDDKEIRIWMYDKDGVEVEQH